MGKRPDGGRGGRQDHDDQQERQQLQQLQQRRRPHRRPRHRGGRRRGIGALAVAVVGVTLLAGCLYAPTDDVTVLAVLKRQEINSLLDAADAADRAGDDALASDLRATAEAKECESFRCRAPLGTAAVAMDPAEAGGFFSMPWPSDTRRRADAPTASKSAALRPLPPEIGSDAAPEPRNRQR